MSVVILHLMICVCAKYDVITILDYVCSDVSSMVSECQSGSVCQMSPTSGDYCVCLACLVCYVIVIVVLLISWWNVYISYP